MARKPVRKHKKESAVRWMKDHFLPNARNGHVPHFFGSGSLAAVAIAVLILHAAYFGTTQILFRSTDFLASVLPSVLISLTNDDRAKEGLGSLEEDAELTRAAQMKADDMAEKGYFSHKTPDGKDPWYWFQLVGYQYQHAGENLAINFNDSEDVEEAWMASPTHRANIVKPVYTKIGIGVAKGEYEGKNAVFVVQLFATPKVAAAPKPAPEPVATPSPAREPEPPVRAVPEEPETPVVTNEFVTVGDAAILGNETEPAVHAPPARDTLTLWERFLASVTSPSRMLQSALYGFLALTLFAVLFIMLVRFRIPHPGVIVGGSVMTALFLGALYLNASLIVPTALPDDQTANAISAVAR